MDKLTQTAEKIALIFHQIETTKSHRDAGIDPDVYFRLNQVMFMGAAEEYLACKCTDRTSKAHALCKGILKYFGGKHTTDEVVSLHLQRNDDFFMMADYLEEE